MFDLKEEYKGCTTSVLKYVAETIQDADSGMELTCFV